MANPAVAGHASRKGNLRHLRLSFVLAADVVGRASNTEETFASPARAHRAAHSASPRRNTMSGQLPPFVQEMLRTPPHAGEGVHDWLFKVAKQLHWHMGIEEMADLLENATANCGRVVLRREILDAIRKFDPLRVDPDRQSVTRRVFDAEMAEGKSGKARSRDRVGLWPCRSLGGFLDSLRR